MDELERIHNWIAPRGQPNGLIVTLNAETTEDAREVLARVEGALTAVLQHSSGEWPSLEQWRQHLPSWLVARFAEETDEKVRPGEDWTLAAWTLWFKPSERSWHWWRGRALDRHHLSIEVVVDGLPFAMGSLEWLLNAAGAERIEVP
jgi:hypothetical protein